MDPSPYRPTKLANVSVCDRKDFTPLEGYDIRKGYRLKVISYASAYDLMRHVSEVVHLSEGE
jgi:hypothetical protein